MLLKKFRVNVKEIELLKGDLTALKVDCIVNAASESLRGGGGVDGAIHRAGGPEILEECKRYENCPTGETRLTSGGKLFAKYVIHTVGPIYKDGCSEEAKLLERAYFNSMNTAEIQGLNSITFPFISAGVYGYPKVEASRIAIKTVLDYMKRETVISKIIFCVFSEMDYHIYEESINEYIEKESL